MRRGEAGFNFVILMIAVTVMMILVGAALPAWSTAVRRDKEEELIFRGIQYAEALRVFQQRFGRLPTTLDELVKTEPRSIRQLWPDPMTGRADWVLIRTNAPPDAQGGGVEPPEGEGDGAGEDGRDGEGPSGDGGLGGGIDGTAAMGPIRGVRSRSREDSLKTFLDRERYDQWLFTIDLLQGPSVIQSGGAGVPAPDRGLRLSARWIGRPFRPGLQDAGSTRTGGAFPANEPPRQQPEDEP